MSVLGTTVQKKRKI